MFDVVIAHGVCLIYLLKPSNNDAFAFILRIKDDSTTSSANVCICVYLCVRVCVSELIRNK